MDIDQVWAAIDTHRGATADLLATLSDQDWCQPSLCDGWTVRDVAAHLTLQQLGLVDGLRMALRHGVRDLNRTIREAARVNASADPAELIGGLRDTIGSRRHNIGLTPRETLIDILVHSQDIAIPLRRELPLPQVAAGEAASRVWSYAGGRKAAVFRALPVREVRLEASDIAWEIGVGPLARGPISAVLLALTGRRPGVDGLTGPGAERLRVAFARA